MTADEDGYTRDVWGGRNLRSATLAVLGVLAVIAIALTLESGGDPVFQSDVARALASRSDAVAASLARGNRCAADLDADELRTDSVVAARRRLISSDMASELLARTGRLARSISCPPPPAAQPSVQRKPKAVPRTAPRQAAPPRASGHGPRAAGHGKRKDDRGDRGRGKKRGHRGDKDS